MNTITKRIQAASLRVLKQTIRAAHEAETRAEGEAVVRKVVDYLSSLKYVPDANALSKLLDTLWDFDPEFEGDLDEEGPSYPKELKILSRRRDQFFNSLKRIPPTKGSENKDVVAVLLKTVQGKATWAGEGRDGNWKENHYKTMLYLKRALDLLECAAHLAEGNVAKASETNWTDHLPDEVDNFFSHWK